MMRCSRCHAKQKEGAAFCSKCGADLCRRGILNHIVGFRSRNKVHMLVAGIYYLLSVIIALSTKEDFLFSIVFFFTAPITIFAIIDAIKYKSAISLIPIPICFIILVIAVSITPNKDVKPSAISIAADEIYFEDINQEIKLDYSVKPGNANYSSVKFYSENEDIAVFDDNVLKAISEGETFVYAEIENTEIKSDKVKVTVVDKENIFAQEAQNVIEKIDAIGTVTLESKNLIEEAETAYNALTPEAQGKVTNYSVLTEAIESYRELETKATGEAKAAEEAQNVSKPEQAADENSSEKFVNKGDADSKKTNSITQPEQPNNSDVAENSIDEDETVYIGKTGSKYHYKNCRTLKGGGHAISLSKAKQQGYTPCKVCH